MGPSSIPWCQASQDGNSSRANSGLGRREFLAPANDAPPSLECGQRGTEWCQHPERGVESSADSVPRCFLSSAVLRQQRADGHQELSKAPCGQGGRTNMLTRASGARGMRTLQSESCVSRLPRLSVSYPVGGGETVGSEVSWLVANIPPVTVQTGRVCPGSTWF